jgi:hypothetical protein
VKAEANKKKAQKIVEKEEKLNKARKEAAHKEEEVCSFMLFIPFSILMVYYSGTLGKRKETEGGRGTKIETRS